MFARLLSLAALTLFVPTFACQNRTCTSLAIVREMPFEATLPKSLDASSTRIELCLGKVCDTSTLVPSAAADAQPGDLGCKDEDEHTENFPSSCTFTAADRKLSFKTNTVYGGHAGSDPLTLTAIDAGGTRTPLTSGTVRYEDTTDDAARGACTEAWKGTFSRP